MAKICLLSGFDKKMMPYAMVAICSLLDRLDSHEELEIGFVIGADVTEGDKDSVRSIIETRKPGSRIMFHSAGTLRREAIVTHSALPFLAAFKLLAGDIGFTGPRVLTVDADMFLRASVTRLFGLDLMGNVIGAVEDKMVSRNLREKNGWRTLGLRSENGYFNSGLMLIDLDLWRKSGMAEKTFSLIETASKEQLRLCEQTPFNLAIEGRWLRLDRRWNRPMSREGLLRLSREGRAAFVWHFQSRKKPWNPFPRVDAGSRAYWAEAAKLRIPLVPKPKARDFARGFLRHFLDSARAMARRVESKKLIQQKSCRYRS